MKLTQDEEKIIQAYRMGGEVQIYFFNDEDDKTKRHAEGQLKELELDVDRDMYLTGNNFCIASDSTIERVEVTAYYQVKEGN